MIRSKMVKITMTATTSARARTTTSIFHVVD